MIGKLFTKRFLSLVLATIIASFGANAQTTIVTNYTGINAGPFFSLPPAGQSIVVTFQVENFNTYPIVVEDVLNYHADAITLQFPTFPPTTGTHSANGSTYDIWSSNTALTGPATIAGPAWTQHGTPTAFSAAGNGVRTVRTGLDVQIPPGGRRRFAVVLNDTMGLGGRVISSININPPAPRSFTSNGVRLTSVDSNQYTGVFPTANNLRDSMGFYGGISFSSLVPPTITAVTRNVCLDGTINIVASANSYYQNPTYTWYKDGVQVQSGQSNVYTKANAALTDSGSYCVEVKGTNNSYTSQRTCVKVKVIDPPAPKVSGKFNYCINEPFVPVTVHGNNPVWYYVDTLGSPIPLTPTINTSTPNVLFYYVSQTDINGCESSNRTIVRLSAAPKPAPPTVTTPTFYCELIPAEQLTAVGDTLQWYYSANGGIPTSIAPTPNTTKKDVFEYFVSQKIDGCESDRSRMEVIVTFRPNGQILVDKDNICANDSIEISYYGSAFPQAAYNWELPNGSVQLNDTMGRGPYRVKLTEAGTQTVGLRVGVTGCLSEKYTYQVGVKPIPSGTISSKDDLCVGQDDLIVMDTYTETVDTFSWDFSGGQTTHFTTDQGPYGVFWNTDGKKYINVTLYDEGCVNTITDSVEVHKKPDSRIVPELVRGADRTFDPNTQELCDNDSLKLSVATIEIGSGYNWSPARFFETYDKLPVTYARINGDNPIILDVVDEFGCENSDTIIVKTKPCCEITFPSAFSPNNDGMNDLYRPVTIGKREIESFRVYNRYGQVVYQTNNISRGWDGTMNGTAQPLGTYFYMINFICGTEKMTQKGEFVLVR